METKHSVLEYSGPYRLAIVCVARPSQAGVGLPSRALVLRGLGEDELAIEQLERALQERSGQIVYLKVEPIWASLRSHPRFKKLPRILHL